MKRSEIIKLLKLMAANTVSVSHMYDEDDKEFAEKLFREYMGLNHAIMVLERPEFAKKMAAIYIK